MPQVKLAPAEVLIIKRRIWNGDTRTAIAEDFPQISLSQILNIGAGYRWPEIPWPDGSAGALPEKRKELIAKARARVESKLGAMTRRELQIRE